MSLFRRGHSAEFRRQIEGLPRHPLPSASPTPCAALHRCVFATADMRLACNAYADARKEINGRHSGERRSGGARARTGSGDGDGHPGEK